MSRTRSTPVTDAAVHVEPLHTEGPITAAVVRDDRAWVAGGRNSPWLMLFDAVSGGSSCVLVAGVLGGGCVYEVTLGPRQLVLL
jgi:hypothetical protein